MERIVGSSVVVVLLGIVLSSGLLTVAVHGQTMAAVRGQVTDQWENDLENVQVIGRCDDADPRVVTTNNSGRFNLNNLPSCEYVVEFRADGYQPTAVAILVEQRDARQRQRPLEIELAATPPGSLVRDDSEFESDDGNLKLKLKSDGTFEFEDDDGDGEGSYGIVELDAILTIRDYDGDDDRYSLSDPVTVTFSNNLFNSVSWGDATLSKK